MKVVRAPLIQQNWHPCEDVGNEALHALHDIRPQGVSHLRAAAHKGDIWVRAQRRLQAETVKHGAKARFDKPMALARASVLIGTLNEMSHTPGEPHLDVWPIDS